MKAKNTPVGTVDCPNKRCDETANVFKFRPRPGAEGRKTVFTNKHYCECPTHGRIGADGNASIDEYIRSNAKWSATAADSSKTPAPATTPARTAAPASSAPAKTSEQATPTRSTWRTLLD